MFHKILWKGAKNITIVKKFLFMLTDESLIIIIWQFNLMEVSGIRTKNNFCIIGLMKVSLRDEEHP